MAKGELVVKKKETNCSEVTLTAATPPGTDFQTFLFCAEQQQKKAF